MRARLETSRREERPFDPSTLLRAVSLSNGKLRAGKNGGGRQRQQRRRFLPQRIANQ